MNEEKERRVKRRLSDKGTKGGYASQRGDTKVCINKSIYRN